MPTATVDTMLVTSSFYCRIDTDTDTDAGVIENKTSHKSVIEQVLGFTEVLSVIKRVLASHYGK